MNALTIMGLAVLCGLFMLFGMALERARHLNDMLDFTDRCLAPCDLDVRRMTGEPVRDVRCDLAVDHPGEGHYSKRYDIAW